MEPTGPEQNSSEQEMSKSNGTCVEMRSPVFSYVANKLAPVYQHELDAVRRDGSFAKIKEFHEGPFGTLMSQVLDTATALETSGLEKISLTITDAQMSEIRRRVEPSHDAAGRLLHTQLMGELADNFRSAKFEKRMKEAKQKVKSLFGRQ